MPTVDKDGACRLDRSRYLYTTHAYYYRVSIYGSDGSLEHTVICRTLDELADVAQGRRCGIASRNYHTPDMAKEYNSDTNQKALCNPDYQNV